MLGTEENFEVSGILTCRPYREDYDDHPDPIVLTFVALSKMCIILALISTM